MFGCVAYNFINKHEREKFDDTSKKCIFIGYSENAYRLWSIRDKKVILGRHVTFNESENIKDVAADKNESKNIPYVLENDSSDEELEIDDVIDNENKHVEEEREPTLAETKPKRNTSMPARFKDYQVYAALTCADEIPNNVKEVETDDDCEKWKEAMNEELKSLEKNGTWELVDRPKDVKVIPNKWVFDKKLDVKGNVKRYKARLVAKGCAQGEVDFTETFSPVARGSTIRTMLSVANHKKYHAVQMDVKSAFLHGYLEKPIYMEQPEGMSDGTNRVCKLIKSIYGLKESSKCWNERFHEEMKKLGFTRLESDRCVYVKRCGGVIIYVLIYVDDIIVVSNKVSALKEVTSLLREKFEMSNCSSLGQFLGMSIDYDREKGVLKINQTAYIDRVLKRFGMTQATPKEVPMDKGAIIVPNFDESLRTKHPFRELLGALMYAMLFSRPDLSVALNLLSRVQEMPTDNHWKYLTSVLRYLKGTKDVSLVYKRSDETERILSGYVDADFARDVSDRKSTSGYCMRVFNNTVLWATRKQALVTLSTTEAEYVAMAMAMSDLIYLKNLLTEMGIEMDKKIVLFEDNMGAIYMSKNASSKRCKHIDVKYHFVKQFILDGTVCIEHIDTKKQIADIFTKPLCSVFFKMHCNGLGLE
ncbi:unnamed protein product [Allacma fusca]|uniref:Reverse transcriptase Ty1/copia-type domain-containing protein n=1 Tax=Allacma fusca TaxID=39272 RepID=A0A8J2NTK5_9HEXA|nr:unnamed protein product [Allacma fusca]